MPIVFEEVQAEIEEPPARAENSGSAAGEKEQKLNEAQLRKLLDRCEKLTCRTFAD